MIGTIRKHSKWLWAVIIAVTVVAFIYWGAGPGSSLDRPGGGRENLGSINGQPVTVDKYTDARREVYLRYFFRNGRWPDRGGKRFGFDEEQETFIRLVVIQKLEDFGIHPSSETVARAASQLLRSFNGGNPMPLESFKPVLQRAGLTVADFQRYLRHELGIQQLIAVAGMSGELVTPREVRELYARENEELAVQAVFFHASNHLANVTATPEDIMQFYTNQMARYRLPERIQVSFVRFPATNFWAEAVEEINQITNLTERLEAAYETRRTNLVNSTITPEEAKENILKEEQRRLALSKSRRQANAFASELFDMMPVQAANLEILAAKKGLTVEVTEPFSQDAGPKEIEVGQEFVNAAFKLTDADPFAGEAIVGFEEAYVIALKARLPSENPPYAAVHDRVTEDYRFMEALRAARRAGDGFYVTLTNELAAGKEFSAICTEAGLQPVTPRPFSLSTTELPEVESHVNLQQFKQAAFTASVGKPSQFFPTRDGGFIVYVKARLPLDTAKMDAAITNFTLAVRQARQNEVFNDWFRRELDRGLREIPYFSQQRQQQEQSLPVGAPPQ